MMKVLKLSDTNKDFFTQVYQVVRLIPRGKITSYGAIGRYLGSARSARMVGWALNGGIKTHPEIPAHRVVNQKGILSGKNHFPTPTYMQDMLESEGLVVKNNQVMEFEKFFWDPTIELKW